MSDAPKIYKISTPNKIRIDPKLKHAPQNSKLQTAPTKTWNPKAGAIATSSTGGIKMGPPRIKVVP